MAERFVVLVPTKSRPHAISGLVASFEDTCTSTARMLLILDEEDPCLQDYRRLAVDLKVDYAVQDGHNLITGLNFGARIIPDDTYAVGFMGDDHRPLTVGWDTAYLSALRELGTGIVYGDDLLQGEALPTQVAMTADIPRAVGYFAPTDLVHLYCDNYWLDLGREANCIRYLPDVIVKHAHPATGEVEWDDQHCRVNAHSMYVRDAAAYANYRSSGAFGVAVESVRRLSHDSTGDRHPMALDVP